MNEFTIGKEPKGVPGLTKGSESTLFSKGDILIVKGQQHIGDVAWPGNWDLVNAEKWAYKIKKEIEAQGHRCLWVHIQVKYELIWSPWPVNRITVTEDIAIYGLHDSIQAGVIIALVVVAIVGMYLTYRIVYPLYMHAAGISPEDAAKYGEQTSLFGTLIGALGQVVAIIVSIIILLVLLLFGIPYIRKMSKALSKKARY